MMIGTRFIDIILCFFNILLAFDSCLILDCVRVINFCIIIIIINCLVKRVFVCLVPTLVEMLKDIESPYEVCHPTS